MIITCLVQAAQPVTTASDLLALDKDTHEHPSLKFIPEIQTPPPEEMTPPQPELKIPSTENSRDAPVETVDTLTPPPETDSSLSEGFVKNAGEAASHLQVALPQHSTPVILHVALI